MNKILLSEINRNREIMGLSLLKEGNIAQVIERGFEKTLGQGIDRATAELMEPIIKSETSIASKFERLGDDLENATARGDRAAIESAEKGIKNFFLNYDNFKSFIDAIERRSPELLDQIVGSKVGRRADVWELLKAAYKDGGLRSFRETWTDIYGEGEKTRLKYLVERNLEANYSKGGKSLRTPVEPIKPKQKMGTGEAFMIGNTAPSSFTSSSDLMKWARTNGQLKTLLEKKKGGEELLQSWIDMNLNFGASQESILARMSDQVTNLKSLPDKSGWLDFLNIVKSGKKAPEYIKGGLGWMAIIGIAGSVGGLWDLKSFVKQIICALDRKISWVDCESGTIKKELDNKTPDDKPKTPDNTDATGKKIIGYDENNNPVYGD